MTLIEQCILFQKINLLFASIEYLRSFLWRLLLHSLLVAFVVAAVAVAAAAAALQTRRFSFDVARLLATTFKAPWICKTFALAFYAQIYKSKKQEYSRAATARTLCAHRGAQVWEGGGGRFREWLRTISRWRCPHWQLLLLLRVIILQ